MSILLATILAAGLTGPLSKTVVSPEWLAQNLDNPDVVVVEIGTAAQTNRPHIPGARFVPIESIVTQNSWPPDELPPVDQLRLAFENAGVGDNGRIVLYSSVPLYATRAWLTLDYLGQGDRTSILDGGYARWTEEKRPLATKRFPRTARTFTAYPDATRLITHDQMRRAVDNGEAVVIDARSSYEFQGVHRGHDVARRGHIPNAQCMPWQANLAKGGVFRSPETLKSVYANIVGAPDKRVVVYCRTGMEASMPYFVLRSLGYNVALYDGSYTEWSRDRSAPVVKKATRP